MAVDEQIIPVTETSALKQFIGGKPNPEGLNNFVCTTANGLVIDFKIYQDKIHF